MLPKNLKNEIKNSIKSEEKIDSFENIKLENSSQIEKKTKESILILNNDPITFLNLITILNKKYIVKQTNSLDKLIDLKNKNENSKIMIDISKLSDLEKNLINEKLDNNLIILYSNDELTSIKEGKIEKSFKLPLSNEEINNI